MHLTFMAYIRYYVAEGVRLYSQETWRQVTGAEGKTLVEKYIDSVVRECLLSSIFYIIFYSYYAMFAQILPCSCSPDQ